MDNTNRIDDNRNNKSKIFYQYRENNKIKNIIYSSGSNYDNINKKLEKYVSSISYQFIKFHNKYLDFKNYAIVTIPYLPTYIFVIIFTTTNTNHPYLLFLNLEDIYLHFLIPCGKDFGQADFNNYYDALPDCNIVEKTAMYILIEKSIMIRKQGIIGSKQYTLIAFNNITNCIKKMAEINKQHISEYEKTKLRNKASQFYLNKAIDFLKQYFYYLDVKNFDEAYLFLKGDGDDSKYYRRQRLNTFFKDTQNIIGHLEIFIPFYQLFYAIRMQIYNI